MGAGHTAAGQRWRVTGGAASPSSTAAAAAAAAPVVATTAARPRASLPLAAPRLQAAANADSARRVIIAFASGGSGKGAPALKSGARAELQEQQQQRRRRCGPGAGRPRPAGARSFQSPHLIQTAQLLARAHRNTTQKRPPSPRLAPSLSVKTHATAAGARAASGGADPVYVAAAAFLREAGFSSQAEVARVLDIAMNPNSLFVQYNDAKRSRNASVSNLALARARACACACTGAGPCLRPPPCPRAPPHAFVLLRRRQQCQP